MHILNTQLPQSNKFKWWQFLNILIIIQNKFLNFKQARFTQITDISKPTIR